MPGSARKRPFQLALLLVFFLSGGTGLVYELVWTRVLRLIVGSTTLSLTVTAAPNFALSASPTSLSIARGAKGTTTITITPSNGFAQSVTLSASGLRSGTTAAFSANPSTKTTTLTLAAGTRANVGTATVTITGKSGGLTHSTTISVTVHR